MYVKITRGIKVIANPVFLADQSEPENGQFFWAYQITIRNMGYETVTLKSRFWKITDGRGQ